MGKIAQLFAMLFCIAAMTSVSYASGQPQLSKELKAQLIGSPVFIQIFKEERTLELYAKVGNEYRLLDSYRICDFSGGLGPKRREGDFKSPEGFYSITHRNLNPNSHYYRAINIGFPNDYDRYQGYSGAMLMIHGDCRSIGCYAMTNSYIADIYRYVDAALLNGQAEVKINIFPFRMTEANLQRHRLSNYYSFWRSLEPGYAFFARYHQPPAVAVVNGQYAVSPPLQLHSGTPAVSQFALTQPK
ncbi:peptidoglycan meso-diaminopimelic acid protein amidase [Acerihabitans sp. TG2]|uniref:peptidoglycan meso-diaminopimelic acid protein amidase n=1 Tax=Acerihabitans sp. TG2 TaxID=3096008 RepID=UPI002B23D8CF|nr:peptidoglycan meso-diaminopimelic acid protein amidase [Acerihabitans sp. TG2]MEA9390714.1 peptidoglycan meso-diaminopimelic acid protein amidase [Acerihabitans sp. TG2]